MNRPRLLCLLILLVMAGRQSHAQAGAAQGEGYAALFVATDIPDANVTGIVQDPRGFIWVGTRSGLFRYDGIGYKAFKNGPPEERKLTFNLVRRIYLANERLLIVEGQRQLNILDLGEERLTYASPADRVFLQTLRHGDNFLFHFEDEFLRPSLFRLNASGTLDSIPLRLLPGMRMDRACFDGNGQVYFFDKASHLWQLSLDDLKLTCLDPSTFAGRRLLRLPVLHVDQDGRLWAFDKGGETHQAILQWSGERGFVRATGLPDHLVPQPGQTPSEFWLLNEVDGRLSHMALPDTTLRHRAWIPPVRRGTFTCLLEDRQGNLWIGTQFGSGKGIILMRPHLKAFEKLLYQAGLEQDIGIACRSMDHLRDGTLVVGGRDGMFSLDPASGTARQIRMSDPGSPLKLNGIWKIVADPDGKRIWFTKEEGGLFEHNLKTGRTRSYLPRNQVSDRALGLLLDSTGLLWIGTRNGLAWFDTRTHSFDHRPALSAQFFGITGYNWVKTGSREIWLCSSNGLYLFDPDRRLIRRFGTDTEPHLHSDEVYDIILQDSVYWIATDNGLHSWDGTRITRYTTDDGLPHNIIASLSGDDQGRIWIATFDGLSCFDPATRLFQNFYAADGLPHNEFNRQGKFRDGQGRLYFATQNGIVRFNPHEPFRDIPAHRLVLTGFRKFDEQGGLVRLGEKDVRDLRRIDIRAGNKYFQLDFALLNFINSADNRYSYYLEDLETEWRPLIRSTFLQYNNLPAGQYTLHVRAVSPEGRWAENTLDLEVRVREHFYQNTGFRLLAILILIALIIGYIRMQLVRRLDLERMRNRISADLHDEVGGVLSGIAMQMDLLEHRAPDAMKPFMQRIASSSRNAALTMRDVIWSIDAGKDTLGDLADRMKAYTVELLSPLEIRYSFDFSGIQPNQGIPVDIRQNVYLVFKEALNNAMKHSGADHVSIRLAHHKSTLTLVVSDTGKGMPTAAQKDGQGLANMTKRARRIGGTLRIGPGSDGGTTVSLACPSRHRRM